MSLHLYFLFVMKTVSKAAAVLICLILLLSPASAASAAQVIDRAEASFTPPAANDEVRYGDIDVSEPGKYGAKINDVYYYSGKSGKNIHPKQGEPYEGGRTYTIRVLFFSLPGYELADGVTEYYVNGKPAVLTSETNTVEVLVKIEPEPDDNPPEEEKEPNIIQRVIAYIRYIIDRIRYFLFPRV